MRFERFILVAVLVLTALYMMFTAASRGRLSRNFSHDLTVNGVALGARAEGPSGQLRELGLSSDTVVVTMRGTADGGWVTRVSGTELRRGGTVLLSETSTRDDVERLLGNPQGKRHYGGPCVAFEGPAYVIELSEPLPDGATEATLGPEFYFGDTLRRIVLEVGEKTSR